MKVVYGLVSALVLLTGCQSANDASTTKDETQKEAPAAMSLNVPVHYETLDNGLKVVLSPDDTAPIVAVGVYYNIGFRIEPKDRTGFAHLFEHMMFQGSQNLPKGEFDKLVNGNGGINNGSTRFDFTNYFEILPSHVLETFVWVEADRMRGLNITQAELTNQQGVVKNEVKVNVLNQPYGGFPWLDLPQHAFDNWYNSHNFYGELDDLDAATLDDVDAFFDRYYTPNNAVFVVVGDLDVAQTMDWVRKYFGDIPRGDVPALPDISEQPQTAQRKASRVDPLAPKPAYSVAYRMPPKNSDAYYAMGLIDQILLQGDDSLLHQALVEEQGITSNVSGGINLLGNMFNYNGPMLWSASLIHEESVDEKAITRVIDDAVSVLQNKPVSPATLARAKTKLRSSLYDTIDGFYGVGKLDLLATFALFDDAPSRINDIEAAFERITPAMIQQTANTYLVPEKRTLFTVLTDSQRSTENTQGEAQ
ncbi:M16 family metallopeptidase [Alteromonas halophila]|uniref:Peptidase M16 n=1 Tax=Alteromonas halophila TaxID=516698 RepID=A0A918MYW9_9ALTE|nr:pitrilysin family protein [Alteromonas halophila]GGW89839.1 peptidase M16 [Alteromonas halophila]